MPIVSVPARIFSDSTGAFVEIPVLLTESGVVTTVMDYCLSRSYDRSLSWMRKALLAIRLFTEYVRVNPDVPQDYCLFQNFAQRLFTGTFNRETGLDPSGLCWLPGSSIRRNNEIISHLTSFFDWLAKERPEVNHLNPRYAGNAHDQRMDQMAYLFRREKAFLGHTWESNPTQESVGRMVRSKREPKVAKGEPPAFPDERFEELLFKGFKVGGNFDYRGMLITLLLHGAGFRVSEPFHLYIEDVFPDPTQPASAAVLIHHPVLGNAPGEWAQSRRLKQPVNRAAYLADRFALPPRNELMGKRAAGWKEPRLDGKYFMRAYWFMPEYGEWFLHIWYKYLRSVAMVERDHPFAFINLGREPRGAMYTIDKFKKAHAAAIERIGLTVGKSFGTTEHGHRHAYGRRLMKAGLDRLLIQRYMHHGSVESQDVYTQPTTSETILALETAAARMRASLDYLISKLTIE